ncbi:MAG: glycosyltransferase family 4 protein [Desulfobacteraceae bacterium]|nr:glycosyltransferase family 4 protein [Desulfobacteraceae bacterium]
MNRRLLFLVTEDWYFWSHRLPIARSARDEGIEVLIAAIINKHKERIEKEGFRVIPISLKRKSKNIIKEIYSILEIIRIYRKEKPDIVHHVAIKPILYGSFAAWIAGVPYVVNALTGLGFIFIKKGWLASAIRKLIVFIYRLAFLSKNTFAIFQNPEDLKLFVDLHIVKNNRVVLIRGSGVDTAHFLNLPEPAGIPVITLASRMLWDKGIKELVDATRQLHNNGVKCRTVLVGIPDPDNPASIPEHVLRDWHAEGIVEWWGYRSDIADVFARSNIVALPSYREGLPKVLLEAASCGRSIVATDVPGCREIVRNNINGFLVPPYDSKSLAAALKALIKNPKLRARMGTRSREIVMAEFSEEIVVKQTMELYKKIGLTQR